MSYLVQETPYNSRWWGAPYGRVVDEALFDNSLEEIQNELAPFSVVEFTTSDLDAQATAKLRSAGFWRADTQIPFKINLKPFANKELLGSKSRITVASAAEEPFTISPTMLPTFSTERFWQLRGASEAQITNRFAYWCADLIEADPAHCLVFHEEGKPLGWFLCRRLSFATVELTLAMRHAETAAVGGFLYEAAHQYFARQGVRIGQASFSASNTNVLNIYAAFGAKFQAARHIWLWQGPIY